MSFLIAVHVNEGIVLASDRRTTYTNTQTRGGTIIQRIGIHTTNSTDKTFLCPNGAGMSTCGDASLLGKPITGFIQDMIRLRIGEDCPVSSIPQIIIATVYKGNIIKNLIMDCQSYTKYRPNETTGGIFVSWRRKEELPTGA